MQTEVNQILEKAIQWANKNKLEINYNKSSCLLIGKKGSVKIKLAINFNNNQSVEQIKYLGIIIDYKINWTPHIDYIYK